MNMVEIIEKKKLAQALTREEIEWFVRGAADGSIPDYQLAALLMAIRLNGMNREETVQLTLAMAHSGDLCDLSSIPGFPVDKHSTGGVGDTTTLILAPLVAACGVPVAKMSGRGLGHTGGTLDKLESIPGLRVDLSEEAFLKQVRDIGVAVIGQTKNLAPADKTLYALRDVTATVESLPLIASSIMSKKIAAGADAILLDVKVGSGAFMKTLEDSRALAQEMVGIGAGVGRKTVALITDMDMPLGRNIGNALEVMEACKVLQGGGDKRLRSLCMELAANMIYLAEQAPTMEKAREKAAQALTSGTAFEKLCQMVQAQGGDASYLREQEKFRLSPVCREVRMPESGFLTRLNAEECGLAAVELGAGRETKESAIDPDAGIVLMKNKGDYAEAGECIARLYADNEEKCARGAERFLNALSVGPEKPEIGPLLLERIEE